MNPRDIRALRRNQLRAVNAAGEDMNFVRFTSTRDVEYTTPNIEVRNVRLLGPVNDLRSMYSGLRRVLARWPNVFNFVYFVLLPDGRRRHLTLTAPALTNLQVFRAVIQDHLGMGGAAMSASLQNDLEAGEERDESHVVKNQFIVKIDRDPGGAARQPRMPIRNLGPRGGGWQGGKSSVWKSVTEQEEEVVSDDGLCVRRIADKLNLGPTWEALSDSKRNDWNCLNDHVASNLASFVKVDPTRVHIPLAELVKTYETAQDMFASGRVAELNAVKALFWPAKPGMSSEMFALPLTAIHAAVAPEGPFDADEIPILFQDDHVELADLTPDRRLIPNPDVYVKIWRGRNNKNERWNLQVSVGVAKYSEKSAEVNARTGRAPMPLWGPLPSTVDETTPSNVGLGWSLTKASEILSQFHLVSEEKKNAFVSWDIETVPMADGVSSHDGFVPISCSWAWFTEDENSLDDRRFTEPMMKRLMKRAPEGRVNDAIGVGCIREFIEWLAEFCTAYRTVKIVTFNGARFDHQFLLTAMLEYAQDKAKLGTYWGKMATPSQIHFPRGKLVNFKFKNCDLLDLALHFTTTSLASMGKDFKVPLAYQKIDAGPTHSTIQDIFDRHGSDAWTITEGWETLEVDNGLHARAGLDFISPDGIDIPAGGMDPDVRDLLEYRAYGLNDARVTLLLCRKVHVLYALLGMTTVHQTVGAQSFSAFKKGLATVRAGLLPQLKATHSEVQIKKELTVVGLLPLWGLEDARLRAENVVAGAVKLPTGPRMLRGVVLDSWDVTSQYPDSMLFNPDSWYPIGVPTVYGEGYDARAFFDFNSKVGEFLVTVNQTPMWEAYGHVVRPYKQMGIKRTAIGEEVPICLKNHWNVGPEGFPPDHDWDVEFKDSQWATYGILHKVLIGNLELKMMLDLGLEPYIHKAWVYPLRISGAKLFTCVAKWVRGKTEQDILKGSPQYNPVLRQGYKTLLNSLSGKVQQGAYTESTELVADAEIMHMVAKNKQMGRQVSFRSAVPGVWFVEVAKTMESALAKQYPNVWGAKIYEISRMTMLRQVYLPAGRLVLYSDTDAAKMDRAHTAAIRQHFMDTALVVHPDALVEFPEYAGLRLMAPTDGGIKRFGQFEDEHASMNKNDPGACRGAIIAKKCFAYTDGVQLKISCKGVGMRALWFEDPEEGRVLADKIRDVQNTFNKASKEVYRLEELGEAQSYDWYEASDAQAWAGVEMHNLQRDMQTRYEDFDAVSVHERRMRFVMLAEKLVLGEIYAAYVLVQWFDRQTFWADRGTSMVDVGNRFRREMRVVLRCGVKKVTLTGADRPAELAHEPIVTI